MCKFIAKKILKIGKEMMFSVCLGTWRSFIANTVMMYTVLVFYIVSYVLVVNFTENLKNSTH